MKNKRRFGLQIIAALLLVLLFGVPVGATPVSEHGALSVKGSHLVDAKGKNFQLKGVSTHGIAWFPGYVNKNAFKSLRDNWGANTVRLAMYTEEYGGYCSNGNKSALKKKVQEGVQAATDLGMYVIIDWHVLSDQNPNKHKKEAIAFFKEMAKKYKNQKNVIYEICNEPNGGTSWNQVKSYAEAVIKEIRAIDRNAVILIGTPTWSQDVDTAAKNPIKGYRNLMYTFHFYAATHKESYRKKLESAVKAGLPVFVSEYGICDASGSGSINQTEADKWFTLLNRYQISYMAWNLSNKNETSSLLKSSCKKTSGWTASDLSKSGTYVVKQMKGKLPGGNTNAPAAPGTPSNPKSVRASSKYCTVSLKKDGNWQSGKRYYTIYRLTIRNKSKYNISNWKLRVKFKYAVQVSDKWNGSITSKTNYVTIIPTTWNRKIAPQGQDQSIGFIVSSTQKNEPCRICSVAVKPMNKISESVLQGLQITMNLCIIF